ncbi:hypothetical protein PanWU01x14_052720 [Parasponia andersonii]|uniref:Uncharacterized protein n=1 Tax=Parasponia andersonii TaxID=3476 RepID=A0A2P5DL87_PARAD|nr:hypothetical protein PanWU01x14_052720 [Parasponia andersonii]
MVMETSSSRQLICFSAVFSGNDHWLGSFNGGWSWLRAGASIDRPELQVLDFLEEPRGRRRRRGRKRKLVGKVSER